MTANRTVLLEDTRGTVPCAVFRDETGSEAVTFDVRLDYGASTLSGYVPAQSVGEGLVATGGRAPAGTAVVRVVDVHGDVRETRPADGVWLLVEDVPADTLRMSETIRGRLPAVCFRDAAGLLVRPPDRPGAVRAPIADADAACPACGGRTWETVTEGDAAEDVWVLCGSCGYQAAEVPAGRSWEWAVAADDGTEDDADEEAAAIEQELREERDEMRAVLRKVRFPVYVVDGLDLRVDGWGETDSGRPDSLSLGHGAHPSRRLTLEIDAERDNLRFHPRDTADALQSLLHANADALAVRSDAARALDEALTDRERARQVLHAEHTTLPITVDGEAVPFAVARADRRWAAQTRIGRVNVSLTAIGIPLGEVQLRRVDDPSALVSEAPDAGAEPRDRSGDRDTAGPADVVAQARSLLGPLVADGPFEERVDELAGLVHCGLVMQDHDGEIGVGMSKLGGLPDLPTGQVWPTVRREDGLVETLRFVAQIALADLPPDLWPGPRTGLLSVFHLDPAREAEEVATVLHHPDGRALTPTAWPDGAPPPTLDAEPPLYEEIAVTFARKLMLPDLDAAALGPLGIGFGQDNHDDAWEAYVELLDDLDEEQRVPGHGRLLGWPQFRHGDVLEELARPGEDWTELTSLLSIWLRDEVVTTIAIATRDLMAGRFENVRAGSQA